MAPDTCSLLRQRLSDTILIVLGALLVAFGAWLAFPIPGTEIPQTGQTVAVLLVGALLGPCRAVLAIILYLLMGLAGLPVYSDGSSGWAVLSGISAGYFAGFVLAAWTSARLLPAKNHGRIMHSFLVFVLGHGLILLLGAFWMSLSIGVANALLEGVFPFLYGGLVKSSIAAVFLALRFFSAHWLELKLQSQS